MKSHIKTLILLFVYGNISTFCFAQSEFNSNINKTVRGYQKGREIVYLFSNNLFYAIRTKQKNDVIISECVDTIAKGDWRYFKSDFLLLNNSLDFNVIPFNIQQERKFSDDSIYIKVELAAMDTFIKREFEFYFFFANGMGNYQSTSNYIVLPRDKVTSGNTCNFSLSIKDAYPNCNAGEKCYQRIYFNVFEGLRKEISLNYIVITLPGFTKCFVERMDINNEFIYLKGQSSLFWRGKEFKRIKQNDGL